MMFSNQPPPSSGLFSVMGQPQPMAQPRRADPYMMGSIAQGGASMAPVGSPVAGYAQAGQGIVGGIMGRLQDDARGGPVNRPLDNLIRELLRPVQSEPTPNPMNNGFEPPTFADAPMPTIDLAGTSWT